MRLLILNTSCCWRKPTAPFLFLGETFAARGIDVRHVVGGGSLCSFYGTLKDWNDTKCFGTQDRVTREIESIGNPVHNMRSFETPEMHARVEAWWQEQRHLPLEQRTYLGIQLRNLIKGSLARHLFRPIHPDPVHAAAHEASYPAEQEMADNMCRAAVLAYEAANAALDQLNPDVILYFNGYFYLEWLFQILGQQRGIRTVAHEAACFADRMFFDANGVIGNRHNLSSGKVRHRLDTIELSVDQEAQLRDYLTAIYEGRVNNIPQSEREDLEGLRTRLNIPQDKRIILLIGQVAYDTVVLYDHGTFPTTLAFYQACIAAAETLPDAHLILRLHPHEMNVNNNWTLRQIEQWDLPDNVTVVHSLEANTYQLMLLSDCGVAMTSQAGLEMAAFGKPVVVCGNAFYRGNGFTWDVSQPEELQPALERVLEAGPLAGERKRRVESFLYHHIFEYLVPFDTDNDRFSPEAVEKVLQVLDPVNFRRYARTAEAPPEDLLPDPPFDETLSGWRGNDARLERYFLEDTKEPALRVHTGKGAWSGVLYACEKPNHCDVETLAVDPGVQHTISVELRGEAEAEGVPVQVNAIGNDGQNFGTKKMPLKTTWQPLSFQIRTQADTHHLGLQIVKSNDSRPVAFELRRPQVLPAKRQGAAPVVMRRRVEEFPRLLILSEVPFGNHTGYGVTITNLFRGWPLDRIAQIYRMSEYEPEVTVSRQNLPLYDMSERKTMKVFSRKLRLVEMPIRLALGQFDVYGHHVNTSRARHWLRPFKPEVIFSSPVTYATSRFTLHLARRLGLPYVAHIMDDWLAQWEHGVRPVEPKPYEPQFQAMRNRITRKFFGRAAVRQVISEQMATAYEQRYGYPFQTFHNAIELQHWDQGPRDYDQAHSPFIIRYTGAIWHNIQMPTLQHFAEAVTELAAEGVPIRLEIYTHDSFTRQYAPKIQQLPHVVFKDLVPYDQVPTLMREADALLVPVTFDEKMLLFSQYSMPTKVPEYMISGTPVILYGPAEAAPVAYARDAGWGYVIGDPDRERLKQRLVELIRDPALRARAGQPAQELARKQHDLAKVREAFWEEIFRAAARR